MKFISLLNPVSGNNRSRVRVYDNLLLVLTSSNVVRYGCPSLPFLFSFSIQMIRKVIESSCQYSEIDICADRKLSGGEYGNDIGLQ